MIDGMDHIQRLGYEPTKTEDVDQERSGRWRDVYKICIQSLEYALVNSGDFLIIFV